MDRFAALENRMGTVEKELAKVDVRLDSIENTVNRVEKRMDSIETKVDDLKKWTMGTIFVGFALIIGLLTLYTTWAINDSNRNWEISKQALDKINAIELRLERQDASRK